MNPVDLLRAAAAGQVKSRPRIVECDDLLEQLRLPLKEVKLRDVVKVAGNFDRGHKNIHHAIRIGIGQRLKQNGIHHRKDGSVGADAKSKSDYNGKREARILPQLAQAKVRILPQQLQSGRHSGLLF